jgi:uncharacterized protein (TIGR02722 family)
MIRPIPLCLAVVALAGCGGPRAFTQGEYADPNAIEMLSDQFSENDLQLIAKKMVASLHDSAVVQELKTRPVIVVGKVRNKTSEHIDMESLADKVRVELQKGGKFAFTDKAGREEIAQEYEYQGSGYVKQDTAKGPGQQVGADFLLTGQITSIVHEVGSDKMIYYKFTMQLSNLKSGLIEWTDEKELRKKFRKHNVGM